MAAVSLLNPKAEIVKAAQALGVNISAAKGIQSVMKSNLGPTGVLKMLVNGAGDIKITKDGCILLQDMRISHPTASMIAKVAVAQDVATGDGTTSAILLIGELLKQSEVLLDEELHPSMIADGISIASSKALEVLEMMKIPISINSVDYITEVASTSLKTKLHPKLADLLTDVCVEAILTIYQPDKPFDLNLMEIMDMRHKTAYDTRFVRGLVFDHGSRHPDMPTSVRNAYILICNVSLEYEPAEINCSFMYKTAEECRKFVLAEQRPTEERCRKIIELKKKMCDGTDKSFVVINQKGIDLFSLDLLAKENIIALRRAKTKNMERLELACGGCAVNTLEGLNESHLGFAGLVHEFCLQETKYTIVEECENPHSGTILIMGPDRHTINQMKDALRDGLHAIKNAIEDECVVPGAGAFEVRARNEIMKLVNVEGTKKRLGMQVFAESLLIIPKTLAANSGHDIQDTIISLMKEDSDATSNEPIGLNLITGKPVRLNDLRVWDNYVVKKQIINSSSIVASNLLMVDEIMRAGLTSLKSNMA